MWGKTVFERRNGELVKIVVGQRRPRRQSRRIYDEQVLAALRKIWYLFGCLCGKRLVAVLRTQVPVLEKFGELALDADTRQKLTRISAATVDRLLRTEKRAVRLRGRSHTKPTTRLINEIPIRTFTEWQDARPGEVGADLVGHDGGITGGEHAFTLVVTDRLTQWTEVRAVLNKAQKWVFQALLLIRSWLPFALCSLHTDSGSEFINHHLHRYCVQERIDFTRSRPNRKNDNNFTDRRTTTWCAATSALAPATSKRSSCSTRRSAAAGSTSSTPPRSWSPRPARARGCGGSRRPADAVSARVGRSVEDRSGPANSRTRPATRGGARRVSC